LLIRHSGIALFLFLKNNGITGNLSVKQIHILLILLILWKRILIFYMTFTGTKFLPHFLLQVGLLMTHLPL